MKSFEKILLQTHQPKISAQTSDYFNQLAKVHKPWYYRYCHYTPSNNSYIDRCLLTGYDRELFKLHLKAHKIWKKHNCFYWLYDKSLDKRISNLWIEILNNPSFTGTSKIII